MPRKYVEELGTQAKVDRMKTLGDHADGNGLYLRVREGANGVLLKTWIWRYRLDGKDGVKGLGSATTVTVVEARRAASRLRDGEVLVEEKPQRRTFEVCALQCLDELQGNWSSKNERLWRQTLRDYAFPKIGSVSVADLTTDHIEAVLRPIWKEKTVMAQRLRERIERILEWCALKRYRPPNDRNPAEWKLLRNSLAEPSRVHDTEHHPAMPYQEMPGFIQRLYDMNDVNADCLAWCILTVTRSWEAIGTEWSEFKPNDMWHVPKVRVKQRVMLKLTLSDEAKALIERRRKVASSRYVFPGIKPDQPIYRGALLRLLRQIRPEGGEDVHGFRSAFKDWAEQETAHKNAAIEMAMGHAVGTQVERAYARAEYFRQRFDLANDWASYLLGKEVTQ